jgi:hypothetical protein
VPRKAAGGRKVGTGATSPPDSEKRSPALAGNKRRAKGSSTARQSTTKKPAKTQAFERHFLTVYDGQEALGSIEQTGDRFKAATVDGRKLGTFCSLKAATDAMSSGGAR